MNTVGSITGTRQFNAAGGYEKKADAPKTAKTAFTVCSSGGKHAVLLDRDALHSAANAQTGESFSVYRSESYTKENPVYLIKGTDRNGVPFETEINAGEIDLRNCSGIELAVQHIEAEGGKMSAKEWLQTSIMEHESGGSVFEKQNYRNILERLLEEMKSLGAWDSYLGYKWFLEGSIAYQERR